jgi:hypothetical protein
MNILFELNQSVLVHRLQGMDSYGVKNAFFANYLAALVMLRLQDLKGLLLVNDPTHAKLTKFGPNMSDVNFWGRALFFPNDPLVKKNLQHGHADMLNVDAGRILQARIEKTMKVLLTPPDQINWQEVCGSMVLLRHRFELNSSLFDRILKSLFKWDSLSSGARRRAVGDSFLYLMQSDPKSSLLSRMRELAGSTMVNDIAAAAMKIVSFSRLREDGEGAAIAGNSAAIAGTSAASIGSTSNAIIDNGPSEQEAALSNTMKFIKLSNHQVGSKKDAEKQNKRIKKRIRRFKAIKFKAPAHFKSSKEKA